MSESVNNQDVANRLGVSRAAVSRFRNGSRVPRPATRARIAELLDWPIGTQAELEAAGKWAEGFEQALCRLQPQPA